MQYFFQQPGVAHHGPTIGQTSGGANYQIIEILPHIDIQMQSARTTKVQLIEAGVERDSHYEYMSPDHENSTDRTIC